MTEFNAKEQEAFEAMRTAFDGEDGFGMPMNDLTYGRYLRARFVSCAKYNLAIFKRFRFVLFQKL